MKLFPRGAASAAGLLLIVWSHVSAAQAGPAAAVNPFDEVKRLGRGVNILGYDPIWDNSEDARFKEKHFKLIHEAGFQSVRINLHALQRMGPAPAYKLDEKWLATLDWAVKNALANGLMVILDLHNYEDVAENPAAFKPRLLAFWRPGRRALQGRPGLGPLRGLERAQRQADSRPLEGVAAGGAGRRSAGPTPARTVVVGPPEWNGIDFLDALALPESDRNDHRHRPLLRADAVHPSGRGLGARVRPISPA